MWPTFVEEKYELQQRQKVIARCRRGEISEQEALTIINEMVDKWVAEHPEPTLDIGED